MNDIALPLGLLWPDGDPVSLPVSFDDLAAKVAGERIEAIARPRAPGWTFDELEPESALDYGDPAQAGWTVVVGAHDPAADAALEALGPLFDHRGADRTKVLRYPGGDELDRADWVDISYIGLGSDRPRYVLLAGDPEQLPFELQATLAAAGAYVGRVAFDQPEHLDTYVSKVIASEAEGARLAEPEALVWATDGGSRDPTYYSARYMAQPILDWIEGVPGFSGVARLRDAATKGALLESLVDRPGLVFTASHGMVVPAAQGLDEQRRLNGAWCGQRAPGAPIGDWLLTADDLPASDPAWEGSVVVQFACWGYGTPTNSTFAHWTTGADGVVAESPFVAAIPKKLLANPRGPLGFVGHVDTAWLHGFADPLHPVPEDDYSPRLEPLLALVTSTLKSRKASAYGLRDLAERASTLASAIASTVDRMQREGTSIADMDGDRRRKLADRMIRRNDAMWFLFFGDPGARVRMGT